MTSNRAPLSEEAKIIICRAPFMIEVQKKLQFARYKGNVFSVKCESQSGKELSNPMVKPYYPLRQSVTLHDLKTSGADI